MINQLNGYKLFVFQKTKAVIQMIDLLKKINGEKGLEIEFVQDNLLIKNRKYINLEDVLRIENA